MKAQTLNLSDIVRISEEGTSSVLIELIAKYKKSLYTYFKRYYNCEPALIVTDVFNACQYGFIAPANEMSEAISVYLDSQNLDEETRQSEEETINFNSILLKNL